IENFGFDVPYHQLLGLDFTQAAALQATSYMHKSGLKREDFAEVVVKGLRDAKDNPYFFNGGDTTVGEVMGAQMLSYPITCMERRPFCDGACALILAKEERARELTDKPVWIRGLGSCYDHHHLGDRDLSEPAALFRAARDAYGMAGLKAPDKEIDVFEISEHYSYQFLLWMEGLGLCARGEAAEFLRSGELERGGRMPVNPSGGLLGGVPRYVAGANRVIEAFYQLRGEAEGRAVLQEPRVALAQGTFGPAGQHHCVIILERGF
ncbi:MAG: thiolase family protein, partial [Desulfobacterales bacterium]|nr:thiolase family protein [Desulfobacterales bacterium]